MHLRVTPAHMQVVMWNSPAIKSSITHLNPTGAVYRDLL